MQMGRTGSSMTGWCLWSFLAREVPARLLRTGLISQLLPNSPDGVSLVGAAAVGRSTTSHV